MTEEYFLDDIIRGIGRAIAEGNLKNSSPSVTDVVSELTDSSGSAGDLIASHISLSRSLALKGLCLLRGLQVPPSGSVEMSTIAVRLSQCCRVPCPAIAIGLSARLHVDYHTVLAQSTGDSLRGKVLEAARLMQTESPSIPLFCNGLTANLQSTQSFSTPITTATKLRQQDWFDRASRLAGTRTACAWLAKHACTLRERGFTIKSLSKAVDEKGIVTVAVDRFVEADLYCNVGKVLTSSAGCADVRLLMSAVADRQHLQIVLGDKHEAIAAINSAFWTRGTDAGLLTIRAVAAGAVLQVIASQVSNQLRLSQNGGSRVTVNCNDTRPYVCAHFDEGKAFSAVVWDIDAASMTVQSHRVLTNGTTTNPTPCLGPVLDAWTQVFT